MCDSNTYSALISTAQLNATLFGLNDTVDLDTFYLRARAIDDENNAGRWSNELSASFVNPEDYGVRMR